MSDINGPEIPDDSDRDGSPSARKQPMQSQAPARKRNHYTKQQRTQALADAETLGTCAAAREHNLPASTLSRWRTEQRAATPAAKPAAPKPAKPTATPTSERPPKRKVAKHYTPSQKAEAVEYARKHGATKASKELGPSRYSIYAWIREAEAAAKGESMTSPTSRNPAIEELHSLQQALEISRTQARRHRATLTVLHRTNRQNAHAQAPARMLSSIRDHPGEPRHFSLEEGR